MAAAGPKNQLSLGLEQLVSLKGVLPLWENGSGLRRLRPSFLVMQLSHKSKLHGKQENLKSVISSNSNVEPVGSGGPESAHDRTVGAVASKGWSLVGRPHSKPSSALWTSHL